MPAVREFAAQYAEAAKLPTRVIPSPDAESARLAPAAEAQALRVGRERATSVGGSLEISSQPGSGTAVGVRVPIAAKVWRASRANGMIAA